MPLPPTRARRALVLPALFAVFRGSTGDIRLNSPVAGLAPAPGVAGYWMVAADGGIFAFGGAAFLRLGRRPGAGHTGGRYDPNGQGRRLGSSPPTAR
ncbi:MAG TPA: hypothetical protein VM142_00840 [Acidimicrobiales bacterium]|nr:hypothetical protein [Acidimicrobiales bacterium]